MSQLEHESPAIPDDLHPERVAAHLRSRRFGRSLDVRARTGSTNDDARVALDAGAPDGHVVVADHQTAGRGARGRRWHSPPGTDLYFSIAARVALDPSRLPPLTLAVGLGVARALEARGARPVELKWPNDVWIARRKCAGILVEASTRGSTLDGVILGIGIDVNRDAFDEELAAIATSLRLATYERHDRAAVLADVLEAVEVEVDRLVGYGPTPIVQAVEKRLALRGERVRCDDVEGTLLGLAPGGALRLQTDSGPRELLAGTLRPA
jgi:BirA family biotin operon repressor/biotin-[acetyl-CoA-carboxylase] ligase